MLRFSCFISYSSKNEDFALRLRDDLQDKGVTCWFAPEDMKIGDEIRLDEAVLDTDEAWASKLRRQRHIGDFCRWNDDASYQAAFEGLLRDLKATE